MLSIAEQDWLTAGGDVPGFFAELGISLSSTTAANVSVRCFANPSAHTRDDRTPSCSISLSSGAWNCRGCGETGNAYRAACLCGRTDVEAAKLAKRYGLFLEVVKADDKPKPRMPSEPQVRGWWNALRSDPVLLQRLFELKGWRSQAVVRLGLGWDGERITFPIRAVKGVLKPQLKLVGLVRYLPGADRKVVAWPGSKRDLFPPPELIPRRHPLFVVEGEGTAVAVTSLGLRAVGVPGAGSWRREWGSRLWSRCVIVLPDCDPQGRQLATRIAADVPDAQIVELEAGVSDGSDVGDWVVAASREGGLGQLRRTLERLAA